jgi:pantoate--beta-alanine ligase
MGYLHEGHLSLVERARAEADLVVMSIFVNPLQFAPTEDLARYPRDMEGDALKAESRGVDLLFVPDVTEMYPATPRVSVTPGPLADRWEGAVRPGHFAGVLTVVLKLLNIVQPHVIYMGRKDAQQAVLVEAMCEDLNVGVRVRVSPTVRDSDGLALSSRNVYLSPEERGRALAIPGALQAIQAAFTVAAIRDADSLVAAGWEVLEREPSVGVEYLALVNPRTLEPRESEAETGDLVLVAARVGSTRLIDNIVLGAT